MSDLKKENGFIQRVVRSSKVQVAFGGLVAAVIVAGSGGAFNEELAGKLAETFLTYVLPVLLGGAALEDVAKKARGN